MAGKKKIEKKQHWQESPNTFMAAILQAATRHGDSDDPDMEVGDLQDLVWELWNATLIARRTELMSSEKWNSFIALHGCEFRAPSRIERVIAGTVGDSVKSEAICPKCESKQTHRCKSGDEGCWHCDDCEHAWLASKSFSRAKGGRS